MNDPLHLSQATRKWVIYFSEFLFRYLINKLENSPCDKNLNFRNLPAHRNFSQFFPVSLASGPLNLRKTPG